jgi:hypothetical protein
VWIFDEVIWGAYGGLDACKSENAAVAIHISKTAHGNSGKIMYVQKNCA